MVPAWSCSGASCSMVVSMARVLVTMMQWLLRSEVGPQLTPAPALPTIYWQLSAEIWETPETERRCGEVKVVGGETLNYDWPWQYEMACGIVAWQPAMQSTGGDQWPAEPRQGHGRAGHTGTHCCHPQSQTSQAVQHDTPLARDNYSIEKENNPFWTR